MKCGILTINVDLMNYGNRLQNYALQNFLEESMGMDVLTIKYHPTYEKKQIIFSPNKRRIFYRIIKGIFRRIFRVQNYIQIILKKKKFEHFINEYIKWTSQDYYFDSDFSVLADEFDYMIAGSDQIWNPYWEGTNPIYFMDFMPPDRRISYAASFGVSCIPKDKKEYFRSKLQAIPYISVREFRGVEIVKELTGRDVIHVIDPVFLLTREQWANIAKKPKGIRKQKYLLIYLLGDCKKETEAYINNYAKDNGLKKIYLDKRDKLDSLFASPEEFIALIMNSEAVLTDSFHGVAFSIIFHKRIIYWNRSLNNGTNQDMSSRLVSIFKLFGFIKSDVELAKAYVVFDCFDRKYIDQKIEEERNKSCVYLKKVLKCD